MSLRLYRKKRKQGETPEPFGKSISKDQHLHFVVQKHAASHLHYDFRLEVEGVLKSWAIPKGPSLNPNEKHLSVLVEDHPLEYRHFEGNIPAGNYGAGSVMVWDEGTYVPLNEIGKEINEKAFLESLKKGKISFLLKGNKLQGRFVLIRMKKIDSKENWLLIKAKDEYASSENILEKDTSVLTGRTLDEISENANAKKGSKVSSKLKKKVSSESKKSKILTNILPMLAKQVTEAFDSTEWLFETKWDGYRAIAEVHRDHVELYSRNLLSFNHTFPAIVDSLSELGVEAVFDGEIVALDAKGRSSFQNLQNSKKQKIDYLYYYLFDLLFLEGYDLRELPLIERKELLNKLLEKLHSKDSLLRYSNHILQKGKKFFLAAKKKGEEGIIAKKIDSSYVSHRSDDWLKIKIHAQQEAVICGFTEPRGARDEFGALILGFYKNSQLTYAGHVGGGFNKANLIEVKKKLVPLITNKCPFEKVPKTNMPVTWIKPKLICEVSFQEWTSDDRMRQPIFQGLRVDKAPKEVKKEVAFELKEEGLNNNKSKTNQRGDPPLTNLDKVYWPKEGYTKEMLIEYYREVVDYILPYLKDRPQSLHRFPNGIEEAGFFQKNIDHTFPDWIKRFPVEHKGETRQYMLIQDKKTLLFAANLGCIDFNPFSSRIKKLNYPDFAIFDLDPEDIPFDKVRQTALVLHEVLDELGVPNFCKTSGATGLHVLVPMGAKYTYEEVKMFAELVSVLVHERIPKFTSLERSPSKRQKKVYLDFLQNNFGQTIACPYCVRPQPFAPVSTPLEWHEVEKKFQPTDFTILNTSERVKKHGDIFKSVLGKGIDLKKIINQLN